MTQVIVQYSRPSPDGPVPVGGAQRWRPTKRRSVNGSIVLPLPFKVEILGSTSLNVTSSGADWAWRVDEFVDGAVNTLYVMVPDVGSINFSDLAPVDPDTFEVVTDPEPAWYAFVSTLETAASNAVLEAAGSKAAAQVAQTAASGSATSAGTHASNAASSASAASSSAASASSNANNAASYAANANDSKTATASSALAAAQALADALAARTAAQGHASNAATSAGTATQRAFEANQSAAFAQQKADFAETVANGFSIGTVTASAPGSSASATISGVGPSRKLDLTIPRGLTGPPTEISIGQVETGPETPGIVGPLGPTGPKGDPGGFTVGTDLATSNLNTIITPGLYWQASSSNATVASNYPNIAHVDHRGTLVVTRWAAASWAVQQAYESFGSSGNESRIYRRTQVSDGVWTVWRTYLPARVDQTAGRAIYQWDDLNSREQLIYGDTGTRNIISMVTNGWAASIATLRRVGQTVTLALYMANPAAKTDFPIFVLPTGFRASVGGDARFPIQGTGGVTTWALLKTNGEVVPDGTITSFTSGMGLITFPTNDVWPTTLPGISAGNIPN
jgi:hypothetical protein